jgi:hypothetical protein
MKPTVDLTEDRMFPDVKISRGPEWLLGNSEYDKTFKLLTFTFRVPWEQELLHLVTSDEELVDWRFQISGSAEEYRQREEWRRANSFDYCDRCGKRIVTPWRWDRSLCEECNIALYRDIYYKKTPWESESFWEVNNSLLTIRGAWS